MRLEVRAALLATLGYVGVVAATPAASWRWLTAEGLVLALVVGWVGVSPGLLGRRFMALLPVLIFLGLLVAPGHPERPTVGSGGVVLAIVARNLMAVGALLTLTQGVPLPRLLGGLRRLGVPTALLTTLYFMERYRHVLADELGRMTLARRARTFRRAGRLDWGLLTGLLGVLLVRALGRGERIHNAMRARGWDGTLRGLDGAVGQ